jgi:hypothetical protein
MEAKRFFLRVSKTIDKACLLETSDVGIITTRGSSSTNKCTPVAATLSNYDDSYHDCNDCNDYHDHVNHNNHNGSTGSADSNDDSDNSDATPVTECITPRKRRKITTGPSKNLRTNSTAADRIQHDVLLVLSM